MAEGFECVTLTVPLDHFHDTGKTTQVTFAIKRHTAKGPGKGVFVTATGGPGTSGIQSAVSYRDSFAESVQKDYDVVFFDQRGAYLSGDLTCPDAATAFYRTDSSPAESTATTGLGADARTFVDDCLAESKVDPEPAAVLLHQAGRGGPRGVPGVPRRRQDPAVRRELRHAAGPDVCRGAPGAHRGPVPGRLGRPQPLVDGLLHRSRPRVSRSRSRGPCSIARPSRRAPGTSRSRMP